MTHGTWAIFKRELLGLWVTPLAWVLLSSFLLLQGGVFYSIVLHHSVMQDPASAISPLEAYFGHQSVLLSMTLLLLCPALSMRTFAEERRSGTIEGLLTAPISATQLTLGKYLATLVTYVAIWAPTASYALILSGAGAIHLSTLLISYSGLFLVGASSLALGILMSALSKSQLIALLLTMLCQFGLFLVGIFHYVLDPGPLFDISAHLSLTTLLEETSRGLLDSRRLVLHGGLSAWALFVTVRVVDSWRTT